jgi:hypothetical protein
MTVTLKLTRLPLLNDSIVIKQSGGHFFIAAENSFIIDKAGMIKLIEELGKVGYLSQKDLMLIVTEVYPMPEIKKHWEEKEIEDAKNKEDSSDTVVG